MSKKRKPTRHDFDRLARLVYLLEAVRHELVGSERSIGYLLPVKYVDYFCDGGQIMKRVGEVRSRLDDLACAAEPNHTATSVFYSNDSARTLAEKCVATMLSDTSSALPEEFLTRAKTSEDP